MIERKTMIVIAATGALVAAAGGLHLSGYEAPVVGPILNFVVCAMALASIAHVIGEATDQLGNHLGPAVTGVVQAAVASLLEIPNCP